MVKELVAVLGVSWVFCSGCMAPVGSNLEVPSDAAQTCAEHCHTIGMELTAVAVMASNVGCICQPRNAPGAGVAQGGRQEAVTAGMATIVLQEQAEQQRRRQQQQYQATPATY